MRSLTIRALALAPLTLAGCRDAAAPGPAVRAVRIDAPFVGVIAGVTIPLRAIVDADPGVDTTVRWTSAPSLGGGISPTGVLTTCFPGGEIAVTATSVVDSTKSGMATFIVVTPAVGWTSLFGPVRPGSGFPGVGVPRDSVTGDVDIYALVNAGGLLACRAVERVEIRIRGPGLDSLLAGLAFTPPFADNRNLRIPLRAGSLPNGIYTLSGIVRIRDIPQSVPLITPISLTVRNP